jgi:hypothetical protein
MSHRSPDERAVWLVARAARLRRVATAIRHAAGRLTYHPLTGRHPDPSPGLLDALTDLEQVVSDIQQGAGGHGFDESAQVVLAALNVLRGVLAASNDASLDAPYGHGAPRRHHPGALCTIVAERAEDLAHSLEAEAIATANRARRPAV